MPGVLREGEIDYDVAPIDQHDVFRSSTHDNNKACWYTCALMLLRHRGPVQGLEMNNPASLRRLRESRNIDISELIDLAYEAGLEHTPSKLLFAKKGAVNWHTNLQRLGPLMVIVPHHAVVVRGIVNRGGEWMLHINDPWDGSATEKSMYRFNGDVEWWLPMFFRRSVHRAPIVLTQPVLDPFNIHY
jgi:hypothetical protein